MQSCIKSLIQKINASLSQIPSKSEKIKFSKSGLPLINIYKLVQSCALDIIGETSFGSSFNIVENDDHPLPRKAYEDLRRRVLRLCFPYFKFLFKKDPYAYEFIKEIIRQRISLNAKGERRSDILQIVIDHYSDSSTKDTQSMTEPEMIEQLLEFIFAGSDTSTFTISMVLITLLQHPEKLECLRAELDSAFKVSRNNAPRVNTDKTSDDTPDPLFPDHDTLKSLKYLNAVIDETLRLFPPATSGLFRQTVDKETLISGYVIPEKTIVCASLYYFQRSKEIWGADADEFVPERWLNSEKPLSPQSDASSTTDKTKSWNIESARTNAYYPFGGGSRICIGYNFALMEIRLMLSALIMNFEFEVVEGQDLQMVQLVVPSLRSKKYDVGVQRRILKEELR
ncbi:3234_t:CDS:2 [Acaulospora colombiana]|uniref:3234_t:CDS:1 n=1 Tax=Acaulospora colombiana TaxID=27376 RepID=A0ACA9LJE4_9GLOM|nr:3234_t:CDS:2 [Acaulospora colombiana]